MCDSTDPYTGEAALCTDGVTASGWACTGHAHMADNHIRCTDASHDVTFPDLADGAPVQAAPTAPDDFVYDAIRRSNQVETLGREEST